MIMHETRFYFVIYLPDKVWDRVVPHKLEFDIYRFKARFFSSSQKSKLKAGNQTLTRDAFGTPKLVSAPARLLLSSRAQQV